MILSFYDTFQAIKRSKTDATINFNKLLHVNIIILIWHVIVISQSKFYQLQDWSIIMHQYKEIQCFWDQIKGEVCGNQIMVKLL